MIKQDLYPSAPSSTQRRKGAEARRRKESFFKKKERFKGFLRVLASLRLCVWFCAIVFLTASCGDGNKTTGKKVLILGIDGMDPRLLDQFMSQGLMPNFQKLIAAGDYKPLITSNPPQSPVAWSNFTTGGNPGKHGIFDFIHRDPQTYSPYLSTSETSSPDPDEAIRVGERLLWLKGGETKLLRHGTPFWEYLARSGVWERVFKIPSNFPPAEGKGWSGAGMGTPDILGTYGTFTFYTSDPPAHSEPIGGGTIIPVDITTGVARDVSTGGFPMIPGPPNTFALDPRKPPRETADEDGKKHIKYYHPDSGVPITIYVDKDNPAVKLEFQDQELLLSEGEWSGWHPVVFEMWPRLVEVKGIVRFYLKKAHPLKLYASPVNMDPTDPALPVTNPPEYGQEIAADLGYFYTQGMPENTKARQADLDIFNDEELFHQMMIVHGEDMKIFDWHLDRFEDGMLFFYFGTLDLGTHMYWRLHDPTHPAYDAESAARMGDPLQDLYVLMDKLVGHTLARISDPATGKIPDNMTLIVMSDHGFGPWSKSFQANTWLQENGYLVLKDGVKPENVEYFFDKLGGGYAVDWSRTRAYALGLNGIYVNLMGRELYGAVPESEKKALVDELAYRLSEFTDPATGEKPLAGIVKSYEGYHGPHTATAPDIVMGFRRGYRGGDDSALGEIPAEVLTINDSAWSGDHCVASDEVPGIVITNRQIQKSDPALIDIGPTVLKIFGLGVPADMDGKPMF